MSEPTHWITRNPRGGGNITACGKAFVFPMAGNGWRVRDITCVECDRAICDHLHDARDAFVRDAQAGEAGTAETSSGSVHEHAVGNADAPKGDA